MGKLKELFLSSRIQQLDRDEMLEQQMNDEYARCCELAQKWESGDKNPMNGTIREFEFANNLLNN
tara:strand:+ start:902 stop:1096 length:195 start_codon:yes stop_codon:yes gene_type:complete